jgi:hypothetical protein
MKARGLFAVVVFTALLLQHAGSAAFQQADDEARVGALLQQIEDALLAADRTSFLGLLAPAADGTRAQNFLAIEMRPGVTRAVVIERDRQQLIGALPGYGHRLMVDAFIEYGNRARIATWQLDVRKINDVEWRLADQERISGVDNVYRLSVKATQQYAAKNFTVRSEDLVLTLVDGSVFTVETDQGVTGLVLMGRGDMQFEPRPETEKGQVRIFAGDTKLESRFDAAFIRVGTVSPHANLGELVAARVDPGELRRAEQVFREESAKSYVLDLGDLSPETWWLGPAAGDILAEIRTRRFETLTYARSRSEPEDISLFNRRRQRNIAVYPSVEKLATRGPFYNEDDLAAYDVLDYDIDVAATPTPERQWLQGRTRLRLRVRANSISQVALRLAESLTVQSVVSAEYGRLFHLRVRNQNTVLVNLPFTLTRDTDLTLTVTYSGRLAPQPPERESLAIQQPPRPADVPPPRIAIDINVPTGERSYLYSSRSHWYPQAPISDYATARIRLTIPATLTCVATGELLPGSPVLIPAQGSLPARKQYEFVADRPVRYLAFIVSRFTRVDRVTVAFDEPPAGEDGKSAKGFGVAGPALTGAVYDTLTLTVEANPLQLARGRELVGEAADIARFYHSIMGDSPYGSFTLALVEHLQPGGHSPAYFAALNQPLPNTPLRWQTDPVNFEGYPEFFLAHEMAHQWWGQAVGWRNYHEQWLSEGFAQYFAALYAERRYGDEIFGAMLRQLRKWALDRSDQGPVYLGYRLGHLRNQPQVFRALVYNKGAAVLHMLRRLLGDEAFFRGLRRFYVGARFSKVGTEDLRFAMEAESGWSLTRFFERWIYAAELPRVTMTSRVEATPDGRQEVILRFDQEGDIFDLPVAVDLQYTDRRIQDVLVPVTDRTVEMRVPLDGTLRRVSIDVDDGVLAEIERN